MKVCNHLKRKHQMTDGMWNWSVILIFPRKALRQVSRSTPNSRTWKTWKLNANWPKGVQRVPNSTTKCHSKTNTSSNSKRKTPANGSRRTTPFMSKPNTPLAGGSNPLSSRPTSTIWAQSQTHSQYSPIWSWDTLKCTDYHLGWKQSLNSRKRRLRGSRYPTDSIWTRVSSLSRKNWKRV